MTTPPSLAPETLERLKRISTATLCTRLFKAGFRNVFVRMAGEAVTVRYVPAREDLSTFESLGDPAHPQRRTIEEIPAGKVLVLDCRGIDAAAGLGDILVARLKVRGAAGAVLDGGVRDYAGIAAMGLPVFAKGAAAPANVHRHYAVEANVPIGCAEVLVMPGDVMVGDGDGVVCVPRAQADKIAEGGLEQEELEAFVLAKIQVGAPRRGGARARERRAPARPVARPARRGGPRRARPSSAAPGPA
jgi:regulator of RNase E activity RraA